MNVFFCLYWSRYILVIRVCFLTHYRVICRRFSMENYSPVYFLQTEMYFSALSLSLESGYSLINP